MGVEISESYLTIVSHILGVDCGPEGISFGHRRRRDPRTVAVKTPSSALTDGTRVLGCAIYGAHVLTFDLSFGYADRGGRPSGGGCSLSHRSERQQTGRALAGVERTR